jgi:hypothetical protein
MPAIRVSRTSTGRPAFWRTAASEAGCGLRERRFMAMTATLLFRFLDAALCPARLGRRFGFFLLVIADDAFKEADSERRTLLAADSHRDGT